MLPRVIAIVGPTASAKSALAHALAEAVDGEIVNADALQVYRGLDIGTAKPTPAGRRRVPHHLIDMCGRRIQSPWRYTRGRARKQKSRTVPM